MDTTDPNIKFNNSGVCNHCANYIRNIKPFLQNDSKRKDILNSTINKIKKKKSKQ